MNVIEEWWNGMEEYAIFNGRNGYLLFIFVKKDWIFDRLERERE